MLSENYLGRYETLTHYFTINAKDAVKEKQDVYTYTFGLVGFPPAGSGEISGSDKALEKIMSIQTSGYKKAETNFVPDTEEANKGLIDLHEWLRNG